MISILLVRGLPSNISENVTRSLLLRRSIEQSQMKASNTFFAWLIVPILPISGSFVPILMSVNTLLIEAQPCLSRNRYSKEMKQEMTSPPRENVSSRYRLESMMLKDGLTFCSKNFQNLIPTLTISHQKKSKSMRAFPVGSAS